VVDIKVGVQKLAFSLFVFVLLIPLGKAEISFHSTDINMSYSNQTFLVEWDLNYTCDEFGNCSTFYQKSVEIRVFHSKSLGKSLLSPTLHNKILAFKDFQAILSLYSEVKSRVLAQLREIFDGKVISRYGHGEKIVWQGKLGFIAGVTETIDREFTLHRALGERFLYFRIRPPDRKKAALAAISSYPIVEEMRKEFRRKIREFFESLETSKSGSLKLESYLRREDKEEIAILSSFLGKARTEIIREQGRIETLLDPEGPGRIARSLTALFKGALALRLSRSEAKQIVRRVVLDTIPKMRAYVMKI